MKLFTAALVSLCASLAMAHGEVQLNYPSVNGLSINNACATNDTFRSLNAVKVCTGTTMLRYAISSQGERGMVKRLLAAGEQPRRSEFLQNEEVCSAYSLQGLEVSRNVTTSECAHYTAAGEASQPCTHFVSKTQKVGLTFSVEKMVNYGEGSQQTFVKYTVPVCQ